MIGNGKPGKMPFFSSMKNVTIEPAKIPTIAAMSAAGLHETKEHYTRQHGVEN